MARVRPFGANRALAGIVAVFVLVAAAGVAIAVTTLSGSTAPVRQARAAGTPTATGRPSPAAAVPSAAPTATTSAAAGPGRSGAAAASTPSPAARSAVPRYPDSLDRSVPISLQIPAIGVDAAVMTLDLNADGTVQTPPFSPQQLSGWFDRSPTPGELGGPSVILGHIDSRANGPEVFWRLHELRPGDQVRVERLDDSVAIFRVDRVAEYPKSDFPRTQVYGGGSALDRPSLRLITCGGPFDAAAHNYLDNIVAYATYTGPG